MLRIILLLVVCTVCSVFVHGQRKVHGYPEAYKLPRNPYETGRAADFISPQTWSDVDRKRSWWVVPDREHVGAYTEPSNEANKMRELEWGKSYYVTETKGDWLYLVDAVVDRLTVKIVREKLGWVKASELLLWNEGLINPRTRIHMKCLLLNRYDNINNISCDDDELVQVYLSPTGGAPRDSSKIYSFYFVYKIEGNKYLLGDAPQLRRTNSASNLLGWVDRERLEEWNTRIALEPNFTEAGYQERKNDPEYQIVGFDNQYYAEDFANTGLRIPKRVIWSRDPVRAEEEELSPQDPKRFRSEKMRYPLLSVSTGNETLPYYRSAICDSVIVKKGCDERTGKVIVSQIPSIEAINADGFLKKYKNAANNFDVFFAIEGGEDMQQYRETLLSIAEALRVVILDLQDGAKIRFGALTYGDVASGRTADQLIAFTELAGDIGQFSRFIQNAKLSNYNTNGDLPIQNYGLAKAMQVANFSPFNTNILINVGIKGDFSYNLLRKKAMSGTELLPDPVDMSNTINERNVNLFGIQVQGGQTEGIKHFARNLRGLMLESARKNYNANLAPDKLDERVKVVMERYDMELSAPGMDDPDAVSREVLVLRDGSLHGSIHRMTTAGRARTPQAVAGQITQEVAGVVAENIDLAVKLDAYRAGTIPADGFTPRGIEIIGELYEEEDLSTDWAYEKFELYKPVFFPRQMKSAENPPFSYVLFWPASDLVNYSNILQKILVTAGDAASGEKRELLKDNYCKLLDEFTGGDVRKACEEYTIEEVEQIIQGVENEGISFNSRNIRIGDILDRKKISEVEIEDILRELDNVHVRLREILSGSFQEFSFERGNNQFFWIKVEDIY